MTAGNALAQIPADNWAYTILQSLMPDFVKLQLPVHRILYVSGQHACWVHAESPKASCSLPANLKANGYLFL